MYKWDLHFYLVQFISFFSSKFYTCKVLFVNTFLCFMGCFFSLCVFWCVIWFLWYFQLWKCYRTREWCYICNLCCIYGSGCLYIILCRAAPNICGNHLRSINKDNICLCCLQLRLLGIPFLFCFVGVFFCNNTAILRWFMEKPLFLVHICSRFFPLLPFPLKSIQLSQDVSVSFFSSHGQKKTTACSLHMVFMSNDVAQFSLISLKSMNKIYSILFRNHISVSST